MFKHNNRSEIKPTRVVILGRNGFLASNLERLLHSSGIKTLSISSQEINLIDEGAVKELKSLLKPDDSLVFTACLTPDKGKDAATMQKNVQMAINVAKTLETNICNHLIYISSDAVYAENLSTVSESSSAEPTSLYASGHLTRELILKEICQKKNIPMLTLRPTLIYGPGDTHNGYGPNRFSRNALKSEPIKLFGGGEEKRDHVFVADVCQIIANSLTKQTCGLLNVATGQSYSFMEIARMVVELSGKAIEIQTSLRQNPITYRHFDMTNLIKAFPQQRFVAIEKGLAKILE